MKKFLAAMSLVLAVTLFSGHYMLTARAAGEDDPQSGASMSNTEIDTSNIGFSLFRSRVSADPYTGLAYTHNNRYEDREIIYGIDVSSHNGSINWSKVKAAGIQNVIIRVGYRGYGSSGSLNEDSKFRTNISGAVNAGLNVGVYIFSQAITQQEAADEADFVLDRIKGYKITLPVVIDYEYADTSSGTGGRLYDANLSVSKATQICKAFARCVADEGYTPMIYANKSMLENRLNASELSSRYKIWLANYTTRTSYAGQYDVWQYSSSGSVSGISGNVDCNFWYGETSTSYNGVDYSAVYDYDYYISNNADVYNAYGDDKRMAIAHFVNCGMAEGRQGNEEFNVYAYRDRYGDLKALYGSDLKSYYLHYMNYGKKEGRNGRPVGVITVYNGVDYSAVYSYSYYVNTYSDIKKAFGNDESAVLKQFVEYGMKEGRQGNADFNVYTYKNRYADLRSKYGSDLKSYYLHYINYGKREGRSGKGTSAVVSPLTVYNGVDYSAVYDLAYYSGKYSDIKKAYGDDDISTLKQFVEYGMKEGRQGNEDFNVYTYKNRYPDLRSAYGSDLKSYYLHYVKYGKQEGRSGKGTSGVVSASTVCDGIDYSAVYDFDYYTATNADIKKAYGDDDDSALLHFVNNGMKEGRRAHKDFDVYIYKKNYPDLRSAYGNDLKSYYMHYIKYGKAEGRTGAELENETRQAEPTALILEEALPVTDTEQLVPEETVGNQPVEEEDAADDEVAAEETDVQTPDDEAADCAAEVQKPENTQPDMIEDSFEESGDVNDQTDNQISGEVQGEIESDNSADIQKESDVSESADIETQSLMLERTADEE